MSASGYCPHGEDEVANMQLSLCDVSNVIVVEIENTFGVFNNGCSIRSDR